MADPLGTTASIIAVLQISGSIISLCLDYRKSVAEAPKDMSDLHTAVTSLRSVLEDMYQFVDQSVAEGYAFPSIQKNCLEENGPIRSLQRELALVETRLQPLPTDGARQKMKALFANLKWHLDKKEVGNLMSSWEGYKSTLQLALGTDQT